MTSTFLRIGHRIRNNINKFRGRVAILLYHRLADIIPDPQLLCVSPLNFEGHLKYLQKNYHVIGLSSLAAFLDGGPRERKCVAITFDDGYADNYLSAKPLLEKYCFPATVFVVSGYVGKTRELVSDELDQLLFWTSNLPEAVSLTIGEKVYSWNLETTTPRIEAWDVTRGYFPTLRHQCYFELHQLLRPLNNNLREELLSSLWEQAHRKPTCRIERRIMNADELRELTRTGLIEIGAHGMFHTLLASQSIDAQQFEINESRRILQSIVDRTILTFAYPYGGSDAISTSTRALVQQAGFNVGLANIPGLVSSKVNRYSLPRFLVRNWTVEEFGRRLESFYA